MKYFNRLYAEGLLASETFTQNQQQVLAKGTNEVPLIGTSAASGAVLVAVSYTHLDVYKRQAIINSFM